MPNKEKILQLGQAVLEHEAQAILALRSRIGDSFVTASQLLLKCAGHIIVTGVGKSGHVAAKLAATLTSTGSPAFFLHANEASHGDIGLITAKDVVIAISNSGNTAEIIEILPTLKLLGIPIISLTGNHNSTLAQMADVNLDVSVDREACPLGLAPTTSTTVALAMSDALAVALLEARGFTMEDFARSHPGGTLGKRLLLRVTDIMRTGTAIPKVTWNTPLATALIEITQKRMGITTVVNTDNTLAGIFTDGDLRRTLDSCQNIHATAIGELMTKNCKTIAPDMLAFEALRIMEEHQITALVITTPDNTVAGIIHMHDLLKSGLK